MRSMTTTLKKIVAVILFLVFYFTILAPALIPTAQSYTHSFLEQNQNMFIFQFTTTEYYYNETSGQIESTQVVKSIDFSPFMTFAIDFLLAFLPLIVAIEVIRGKIRLW